MLVLILITLADSRNLFDDTRQGFRRLNTSDGNHLIGGFSAAQ